MNYQQQYILNNKIIIYTAPNEFYHYQITNQNQTQTFLDLFKSIKNKYKSIQNIGLYRAGLRLLHLQQYSIKDVINQFRNNSIKYNHKFMIIPNKFFFKELFDLKQRQIKSAELTRNISKKIPVVVQYDFHQQYYYQNFILEDSTLIETLKALCKRKAEYSAIRFKNMFILLNRFQRNEKLMSIRYLIEQDGFLHVFSSDTLNFEFDNYLLQHNEMFIKYEQLLNWYQIVMISNNNKKQYFFYDNAISDPKMQKQQKIISLICDYKFFFEDKKQKKNNNSFQTKYLESNKKEQNLESYQNIVRNLQGPFQYTIAIGFIYPLLYLIQKSNILIVYNVCQDRILVHKVLPIPESYYAYYQKIPVLLDKLILMYEIFRSNVVVHEFDLQGKLINYYEYEWNASYQFVTTLAVDFVVAKVKPDMKKMMIWKIDKPTQKFQVEGEKEACVFFNKLAFNLVSYKHEFAVYIPSKTLLCLYDFDLKQLKYRIACETYVTWVSFSLSSTKIVYCNQFSDLHVFDLKTLLLTKHKKKPNTYYFYNQNEELMVMDKNDLIKLEKNSTQLIGVDQSIIIRDNQIYNINPNMQHIRKIRLVNNRLKLEKQQENKNKENNKIILKF